MESDRYLCNKIKRPFKYVPKIHNNEITRQPLRRIKINSDAEPPPEVSVLHSCTHCSRTFRLRKHCDIHQQQCTRKFPSVNGFSSLGNGQPDCMTDAELLAILSDTDPNPPIRLTFRRSPSKVGDTETRFTVDLVEKPKLPDVLDNSEEFLEIDIKSVEDLEATLSPESVQLPSISNTNLRRVPDCTGINLENKTEEASKTQSSEILDLISKPLQILRKYGLYLENSPEPVEIEVLKEYGIYLEDCSRTPDDVEEITTSQLKVEKISKSLPVSVAANLPTKPIESLSTKSVKSVSVETKEPQHLDNCSGSTVQVKAVRKSVGILDPLMKPHRKAIPKQSSHFTELLPVIDLCSKAVNPESACVKVESHISSLDKDPLDCSQLIQPVSIIDLCSNEDDPEPVFVKLETHIFSNERDKDTGNLNGSIEEECVHKDKNHNGTDDIPIVIQEDNLHEVSHGDTILKSPRSDKYRCRACDRMFEEAIELLRHSRQHKFPKILVPMSRIQALYDIPDRSKCPICFKPMPRAFKSSFIKHLNTHTDEVKFTCQVCKQNFRRLDHMKAHSRRHIVPGAGSA